MRWVMLVAVMAVGCGGSEPIDDDWQYVPAERCYTHVVDPRVRPVEEIRTCLPDDWRQSVFCWDVPGACDPKISDGKEHPESQASWCVEVQGDEWMREGEMFPGCDLRWDCLRSRLENAPCCGERIWNRAGPSAWNCDDSTP